MNGTYVVRLLGFIAMLSTFRCTPLKLVKPREAPGGTDSIPNPGIYPSINQKNLHLSAELTQKCVRSCGLYLLLHGAIGSASDCYAPYLGGMAIRRLTV